MNKAFLALKVELTESIRRDLQKLKDSYTPYSLQRGRELVLGESGDVGRDGFSGEERGEGAAICDRGEALYQG
ncbi:hypothetical protein AKJ64_00815 [candidate division MSBL1 archaeon SCGC-AAA259E17]|uniref:Uncharacterized protein n=1 Tax=candidate division MSBL1 archaeon SCGC-AAA259E17 TaxID=1698263 RepID=A0A133UGP7_9EURY|nr:hypothetical protein AKJ64_00815 [candidate division MSBL1 archaeon SCGC-AAA259E17]